MRSSDRVFNNSRLNSLDGGVRKWFETIGEARDSAQVRLTGKEEEKERVCARESRRRR